MHNENIKNKRKKSWLFFAAIGIAVVLFIVYVAKTAFSASLKEQKQAWIEGMDSLYEEQIEAFQKLPDKILEHSITLELGNIGRNILQTFIKEDVNTTNMIHIGVQQTMQDGAEKEEVQISIDGEQREIPLTNRSETLFTSITNAIKETWSTIPPVIDSSKWSEGKQFFEKALQAIESQNGSASGADVFINDKGDTVTKTLQYDTYTIVLETITNGKAIELKLNITSTLPEFADMICCIQGNGIVSKHKLSGIFVLQFSDSSITFDIEELDLKKLQNGYIKGTFVIPPLENIIQQATVLDEWFGFEMSKTEWVFSMNSDKGERRIKLTAFLPEELIFAYSIVTEVQK